MQTEILCSCGSYNQPHSSLCYSCEESLTKYYKCTCCGEWIEPEEADGLMDVLWSQTLNGQTRSVVCLSCREVFEE